MIDEKKLQEAIAYCHGKVDPSRNDAILLAACYIIQDHISPQKEELGYSFSAPVERAESYADDQGGVDLVGDYGDSEFLQAIRGKPPADVWAVIDELMQTLAAVNPRVYNGVLRQINK